MNKITQKDVDVAEAMLLVELKKDYLKSDPDNLNMPGLEIILEIIASKVLLPVVATIAGRFGYDLLDDWRKGKKTKAEVISAVIGQAKPDTKVSKKKIFKDIVKDLETEGVSKERARQLVEKVFKALDIKY